MLSKKQPEFRRGMTKAPRLHKSRFSISLLRWPGSAKHNGERENANAKKKREKRKRETTQHSDQNTSDILLNSPTIEYTHYTHYTQGQSTEKGNQNIGVFLGWTCVDHKSGNTCTLQMWARLARRR